MNRLMSKLQTDKWQFFMSLIVVLSFSLNILSTVSVYNFSAYQADSEQLVRNAFYCQDHRGAGAHAGLLIIATGDECKTGTLPYFSQSGGPYWLLGLFYPELHTAQRAYVQVIKMALAVTSALMLVSMCKRMMTRLQKRFQALVYVLLALSPWLVVFSINLFWVLPLLLAPSWFLWTRYDKLKPQPKLLFGILCFLFLTKFLAGYEYSSTLTIGAMSPVIWHELRLKTKWREIIKKCSIVFACAVLGFLLAFSVNLAQASHEMGSVKSGYSVIYERAKLRTFAAADPTIGVGIMNQLKLLKPADYEFLEWNFHLTHHTSASRTDKMWQNAVVLYQYVAAPALSLPVALAYPFNVLLTSIGTFMVLVISLAIIRYKKFRRKFAYKEPLLFSTMVALVGGLSWLIVGYQHSFIHTHINPIIFYLPFLPQSYVILAQELQTKLRRKR